MNLKRTVVFGAIFAAGVTLTACGGGGGGGGSSSTKTATYTGAASAGDLATFTFDGRVLTYRVSGPVFGNLSGSLTLTPVEGPFLYKDEDDNYYYFSGNLGVAEIELDDGRIAWVAGLQNVARPTVEQVAGNSSKNYLYIEIDQNGTIDGYILTVNANNTWYTTDLSGQIEDYGNWTIVDNYIRAYDSENNTYNVIVKPGTSRAGIVVDYGNGNGMGIGLEQKTLTADDVTGTYTSYYYDPVSGLECFGNVTVSANNGTYSYTYTASCSDNSTDDSAGTLELNTFCYANGTRVPLNGIACAQDANSGNLYDVFIDPVDGYYIAVNPATQERVIGSSKPPF